MADDPDFTLAHDAVLRRSWREGVRVSIAWGGANERQELLLTEAECGVVPVLLALATSSMTRDGIEELLAESIGVQYADAAAIIEHLLLTGLLVSRDGAAQKCGWDAYGWSEVGIFERAIWGARFNPDYRAEVAALTPLLEQMTSGPALRARSSMPSRGAAVEWERARGQRVVDSVPDVLSRARHLSETEKSPAIPAELIHAVANEAVAVSETGQNYLGDYVKRMSPSGGGRHPIETYLIVNRSSGLSPGVYHVRMRDGSLGSIREGEVDVDELESTFFKKENVVAAPVIVVLTARWLRHMMKYRYSRSYRMALLDLGHHAEALMLSASSYGMVSYQCPALHADRAGTLLGLPDPYEEEALYAIGLGLDEDI